jgi:hypothetical protein
MNPCQPATRLLRLVVVWAGVVFGSLGLAGSETPKTPFDVADGDAAETLRQLARQARESVVFPIDHVRGIRTNPVRGEFTAREAAERMVAGTLLFVSQDAPTGALTIGRTPTPDPSPVRPPPPPSPMKPRLSLSTLAIWLAVAGASLSVVAASEPAPVPLPKDEPVVLSAFHVNAEQDRGFVAASSLAGALADTPVAYSVQTREFLDALNISDLNEALDWTVSATTTPDDGGGQLFGGTGSNTIRGVSANQSARNFFPGGSHPSTYNLERMDYARGPNSILFGTGTIGGTSNAVVKSARIGRNTTELRAEIGSWDSYRSTLDATSPSRTGLPSAWSRRGRTRTSGATGSARGVRASRRRSRFRSRARRALRWSATITSRRSPPGWSRSWIRFPAGTDARPIPESSRPTCRISGTPPAPRASARTRGSSHPPPGAASIRP